MREQGIVSKLKFSGIYLALSDSSDGKVVVIATYAVIYLLIGMV